MRVTAISALCAILIAPSALAQQYSATYEESTRVRRVEYKESLVLRAVGYSDHPIVLELDPKEPIENAAGGKIAGWEVFKNGSRFFARPLEGARFATALIVTKTRSYVLDLVPGNSKTMPTDFVSKIVVTYPTDKEQAAEADAKEVRESATPLSEALKGPRNDHYSLETVSESIDIRPREVFDDGRFTYFKFPDNLPVPAIYKSTPGSKEEWLVNSHRDGDYVVLHGVGAAWNLRLSGSVLGVFNDAYDAAGTAPVNGTTISGLSRELRK